MIHTIEPEYNAAGDVTGLSDSFGTLSYTLDGLGRVTSETQSITGLTPSIVFASTYDANSNRTQLAATIGSTADFKNDYVYDNMSRMTRVTQQGQSGGNAVAAKRVDLAYNAKSLYTALARYESTGTSNHVATTTFGYNGNDWLTDLDHDRGSTVLNHYDLSYDNMGRILTTTSTAEGLSTFSYDVTSQLTAADHASPRTDESYSFDDNGNRNGTGYTVGTNNRLTEDPTYLYEFDDEGNLTRRETKSTGYYETYDWDHRNRLTKVSFYDDEDNLLKTVEHSYDPLNRWIRRSVDPDGSGSASAVDTFFAGYDGINPTLQFSGSSASNLDHRYLWGEQVDQLFTDEDVSSLSSPGALSWALPDWQGSIRDIAQHNQSTSVTSIANHRVYNAFGSLTSETNSSIDLLFGFTGKPLDDSTGLQNNLNRWYTLDAGWWLSEDPIGFDGRDPNLRRYVGNSPVYDSDPSGLAPPLRDLAGNIEDDDPRSKIKGPSGTAWIWLGNELYWYMQMKRGYREGGDGKPEPYPWNPVRWWANEQEQIPLNPVPAGAIASASEGNYGPAVQEAAVTIATRGLGKYAQGPKTVIGAAKGAAKEVAKDKAGDVAKQVGSKVAKEVADQALSKQGPKSESAKAPPPLRYELGPNDVDLRGTNKSAKSAIDDAFKNTGVPRDEFEVTKWGKDKHGKSFPVEWRHESGAEVSVDLPHTKNGPDAPHVGWQTGGKRNSGGGKRGHIIIDEVPFNR